MLAAVARFGADTSVHKEPRPVDELEETLRARTHHFLALYVYTNATFLAERLVAHNASEANVHLLATCYFRGGNATRAIAVLEEMRSAENRYLLAVCCFQKNKLVEAENALVGSEIGYAGVGASVGENIPNGAAGMYLMGRICRRGNRRQQAIDCFVRALELDATLWSAYEELCELGANLDAARFFGGGTCFEDDASVSSEENAAVQNEAIASDNVANHALHESDLSDEHFRTPQNRVMGALTTPQQGSRSLSAFRMQATSTPLTYRTPNASLNTPAPSFTTPLEVVKKPRVGGGFNVPPNPRQRKTYRRPLIETDEKQRRNARLSFSSAVSEDSPQDFLKAASSGTPVAGRLFHDNNSPPASPSRKTARKSHEGHELLLQLLSSLGAIFHKISQYLCREALDMLERLPARQQSSGWVQHQMGRAYFEMADYKQAHDVFRSMYHKEPHRMAGLDIYSTTLWHMKKEVELSYLAQQVTDFDKLSPEAWCVAGNCFSLQKEHDTALSFFQRAIQLDPYFTYAYTLSGHEYIFNEDFEKATNCFRHAIRIDPRHYNAWYGLGLIYYRQEKYEFAQYHYCRALDINPRSSQLHCNLAMVLSATKHFDEALHMLDVAGELQPHNIQVRFQRASVFITIQRFDEALEELEVVRNVAPRESSVHFQMGKIAKRLGRVDEAMKHFTTALYFQPKDTVIKSAIDKVNDPEVEEDDRL